MTPFEAQNIEFNFGNKKFGGKAFVKSVNIEQFNPESERLGNFIIPKAPEQIIATVEFVMSPESVEWFNGDKTSTNNKISKKKVEDCSIEELFFAIRKKSEM